MDRDYIMKRVIIDENGCWIWQLYISPRGYGKVGRTTNPWGEQLAHRLAYRLWKGDITGESLDHTCYVTACVNPEHLVIASRSENSKRSRRAIEQRSRTHCPHGHPYSTANTYTGPDGRRHCRTCQKYANAVSRAKRLGRDPSAIRREDFVVPGEL